MDKEKLVPELRFPEFDGDWSPVFMNQLFPVITNGFVGTATPHYSENGIKYLQGKNIKNYKIKHDGLIYIKEEFHQKQKKSQLKVNDVLMVQSGHVGDCAVVTEEYENANCHALLIAKPNNQSNSDFIVYLFSASSGRKKIYKITTGNTVKHILASDLKKVNIVIPEKKEQQKIANFLTAIDQRITLLKEKKAAIEDYKKGLMQKIFSQEVRFADDEGNDFPDWEENVLGELSDVRDGTHDSPKYGLDGYPLITSKNLLRNGKLSFDDVSYISENDYKEINKRSNVNIGDILFGMIGTIGNPVIVKSCDFAIKNVALIKEKQLLLNDFLIHYLKSSLIAKQFYQQNAGGTQKFIALGIIRKLNINLPSIEEQQKIADFLSAIDQKINAMDKQISNSEFFKKGLLQRMFV